MGSEGRCVGSGSLSPLHNVTASRKTECLDADIARVAGLFERVFSHSGRRVRVGSGQAAAGISTGHPCREKRFFRVRALRCGEDPQAPSRDVVCLAEGHSPKPDSSHDGMTHRYVT